MNDKDQAYRQTDGQAGRQTGRQAGKQVQTIGNYSQANRDIY